MIIQKLLEEDYFELIKIVNYLRAEKGRRALDAAGIAALYEGIKTGDITFYVIKEKGNILAVCSVAALFVSELCAHAGVFENLYVLPDFKDKGLDKLLTDHVYLSLRENGIKALVTYSEDDVGLGFRALNGLLYIRKEEEDV